MNLRHARRRFLLASAAAGLGSAWGAPETVKRLGVMLFEGDDIAWLAPKLVPLGFAPGRNLQLEIRHVKDETVRFATPDTGKAPARMAAVARELVAAKADVLLGWTWPVLAALREATTSIPIVCGGVGDPVRYGFARSIRRPGLNVTGLSYGKPEVAEIQIGLLRVLLPRMRRLMVLAPGEQRDVVAFAERPMMSFAAGQGITCEIATPGDSNGIDAALSTLRSPGREAIYVSRASEELFKRVVERSLAHRIAVMGSHFDEVEAGVLMACLLRFLDYEGRLAAVLARVLRGANPAELPFEVPERSLLAINRRTAAAIGVTIPAELLIRATKVFG